MMRLCPKCRRAVELLRDGRLRVHTDPALDMVLCSQRVPLNATWRRRVTRVRDSLVGSDTLTPGATHSNTLFWPDGVTVRISMDFIGCTGESRPDRHPRRVSDAGKQAAWRAFDATMV